MGFLPLIKWHSKKSYGGGKTRRSNLFLLRVVQAENEYLGSSRATSRAFQPTRGSSSSTQNRTNHGRKRGVCFCQPTAFLDLKDPFTGNQSWLRECALDVSIWLCTAPTLPRTDPVPGSTGRAKKDVSGIREHRHNPCIICWRPRQHVLCNRRRWFTHVNFDKATAWISTPHTRLPEQRHAHGCGALVPGSHTPTDPCFARTCSRVV